MVKKKTKRENQEKRGMKQISVWVPERDIDATKRYAERKRKAFAKEQSQ